VGSSVGIIATEVGKVLCGYNMIYIYIDIMDYRKINI